METIFSKDSNPCKNYIAFFDLDRTITKAISGNTLVKVAFKKGLMTHMALVHAFYLSLVYKFNLKDPLKIIDKMIIWVEGIPEKTMNDLCYEVFREYLLPSVYEEVRYEIKKHKEKNAKVVILSSALTPICLEMAKDLGMDDIICSDLEIKNGYLTGRLLGHVCFGEEKMVRLKAFCEKDNTKPSDAWYYSDSISDLPALSCAGNPVCVNPDKRLKKEAQKRGWKILLWH
jgi:putative phosphoserine phosphatase / 1-acylglycerol-3-phosphate O-acyltransferase